MLVGAFQIHHPVGAAIDLAMGFQVIALVQHIGVGRAGIEPDIKNVGHLIPVVGIHSRCRGSAPWHRQLEPGIGALRRGKPRRTRIDRLVAQHLAGFLVGEHGDRHTPGALAREHPVGPPLDHAAQAFCARQAGRRWSRRWRRARACAACRRLLAFDRFVHVDEPLRRVAEDDRLFRAPGMRIGVLQPPRANSMSFSISAAMTRLLASPFLPLSSMTRAPSKPGASLV
jgi:hypothetical protein